MCSEVRLISRPLLEFSEKEKKKQIKPQQQLRNTKNGAIFVAVVELFRSL